MLLFFATFDFIDDSGILYGIIILVNYIIQSFGDKYEKDNFADYMSVD